MTDQPRSPDGRYAERAGTRPDRATIGHHGHETLLDRSAIVELLDRFAEEADRREVRVDMFLVGGGAMALAYSTDRTTGDLDGVFEPKRLAYDIASSIATDHDLADDWLNDAVKGFLPGPDSEAAVLYDRPGLTVRVASPRYLFVLKAVAARDVDEDDLAVLYPMCGFADAAEALDHIEATYPARRLSPNVEYLVEQIAADHAQQ